ncbi:MAG TPA: hypothetical protein VFQ20_07425 [Burkholderiaceae bacterium]|nr:hypothetical protein [Burkholderiaceae bacterium]
MASPWLKKNPFMSLWLSAAHRVAGSARGQVAAAVKRQTAGATREAASDAVDFWTGAKSTKRKKRRA